MLKKISAALAVMVFSLCLHAPGAHALVEPFDHSLWDQFVKKYVNEQGEVDYLGAKADRKLLDQYLEKVKQFTEVDDPDGWPREESLALWMNLYHAGLIVIILEHYPVKEINQIPGAWNLPSVTVSKKTYGVNEIRANQLIENFRDEKIHLALSMAAKSGPRFRNESFTGPRVEGQLFQAAREFVNDEKYVVIVPGQKKIELSPIFRWHGTDFKLDFGTADNDRKFTQEEFAVLSFLSFYLEDAGKTRYLEEGQYKIKYRDFDWSLNEWKKSTPQEVSASGSPASS